MVLTAIVVFYGSFLVLIVINYMRGRNKDSASEYDTPRIILKNAIGSNEFAIRRAIEATLILKKKERSARKHLGERFEDDHEYQKAYTFYTKTMSVIEVLELTEVFKSRFRQIHLHKLVYRSTHRSRPQIQ